MGTMSDGERQMVTGEGICAEEETYITHVQGSLSTLMVLDRYGHLRGQEYENYL